jgi:antitoxin component YwqK of YwqJK toxin-antitoxin module
MKRIPDGSLDYINGRMCLDGEPFTGIEEIGEGVNEREGRAEAMYVAGVLAGRRGWYRSGAPCYEDEMLMGVYHGKKRAWHANGQLAEDADYELGYDLRHTYWDEAGTLIEQFEYDANDPDYDPLKADRETYKEEIAAEEGRRKDSNES